MTGRTATALTALLIVALSTAPGSACAAAPAAGPATHPATAPATNPATQPATRQTVEQKTRALHDGWRDRLAAERFNALEAGPFLIAGNGSPRQLAAYRDGTILAAEASLSAMYFSNPREEPVLILLFETEGPYKRLAKKWFDETDVPHFGFYRPWDRCMLMNVGTGTGTLVHELVHALIAPDFPDVPDWFNEGLASLYEQSQIAPDRKSITGLVNWRLPALQKAIKDGTLRPIAEMAADDDFRNAERTGINYAHARYLMLYLQEKGLLRRYYAAFKAGHKDDPTGIETLKKVIGEDKPFDRWEREWKAWVMTLGAGR